MVLMSYLTTVTWIFRSEKYSTDLPALGTCSAAPVSMRK